MAEMRWTTEQANAINARGGPVLVSAAAGSGKTAVLVERVVTLLTEGENPMPADRLLVVTFTNAAAAEMRQRISTALNKRMRAEPDNDFLFQQQLLLTKAYIGTIHSFCGDLLRQNFQLLGLSPDFRIANEAELGELRREALEEVLEEGYASERKSFLRLTDFFSQKDDRGVMDAVLQVYDFIRSSPFPLDWLEEHAQDHSTTGAISRWQSVLREQWTGMQEYALQICDAALEEMANDDRLTNAYAPAFRADREILAAIGRALEQGDDEMLCAVCVEYRPVTLGRLIKYEDKEKQESVKAKREKVKKLLQDWCPLATLFFDARNVEEDCTDVAPVIGELFAVVRKFYERLDEKKHERNVLDFSDLELYSMRLLAERRDGQYQKTAVALQLTEQFDAILIDEYQDTNEVQEQIFRAVSRDAENLFFVGDVKQSIYRFRKAMPELFVEKSEQYTPYDGETYPAKIQLDRNFRSRHEVTDTVNFFFDRLMTREMGEVDYLQERLIPAAEFPASNDMAAELHLLDIGESSDDRIVLEARHIAATIRDMVGRGVLVRDGEEQRPCEYRDFCILLRSVKNKANVLAEELKRQGLAVWCDVTQGYLDSTEITLVLSLLRVLDNPLQDIPMLTVMLSPVFGFTPDDVAKLRIDDRKRSLYLSLHSAADAGNVKAEEFLQVIGSLRQMSVSLKTGRLIQKVYDTTDFVAVVSSGDVGEQKQANLRLLLEYANEYERAGNRGLSGFICYIDRAIERKDDFESANVLSEHSDAVKIMSIHKSKGLEFPICILADLSKDFNVMDTRGMLLLHPSLGAGLQVRKPEELKKYRTMPHYAIAAALSRETLSEEMRVLYVAMTRAKEKLVLLVSDKNPDRILQRLSAQMYRGTLLPFFLRQAKGYAHWILAAALLHPDAGELRKRAGGNFSPTKEAEGHLQVRFFEAGSVEETAESAASRTAETDKGMLSVLKDQINYKYQYDMETQLPAKLSVTQIVKSTAAEHAVLARPSFLEKDRFSAAERGTIFHKFLESCDLMKLRQSPEEALEMAVEQNLLAKEEAAILDRDRVRRFAESPLLARMLAADELLREQRFLFEAPAKLVFEDTDAPESRIQIQGMADCVLLESNTLIIIDYKTDRVRHAAELEKKYRRQLLFYSLALSEQFGLPVKECILYSLHCSEELAFVPEKQLTNQN